MRIFEIALLVTIAVTGFCVIFRGRPALTKNVFWVLAAVGILTLIIHFLTEGYRWQMLPLYALLGILLLVGALVSWEAADLKVPQTIIFSMGIALLTLIFTLPPILFPVNRLPTPTGEYTVGTLSEAWVDTSRTELYGTDDRAPREFVTQTWYPAAEISSEETVDYLPQSRITGRTLATRLGLPAFILDHLTLLNTYSFDQATPEAGPFPVLIFSHGYNSFRGQSTTLMEDLASHGYVVVSMEHTYGSALTVFPDGRIIFHNEDTLEGSGEELRRTGLTLGNQWTEDILYVLEQIEERSNDSNHPFAAADLDSLGVFGHSTGGGVTFDVCAREPRCKAAVGLDAWFGPTPDAVIETGSRLPSFFLMSEFWPKTDNTNNIRAFINNSDSAAWATVKQTGHYDFADIPFLSPLTTRIGLSGGIDPYRGQEINRAFVRGFFDQHLKGIPADYLTRSNPQFPEITFGVPDDVSQNDLDS
ncbi:MAG: hypothetical protein AAF902_03545 [Chloroflexota bacterium]